MEYKWDDVIHGTALRQLKSMLTESPVLQYYDISKPVVIQTDALSYALGSCCLQDKKPVEYASRTMILTERDSYAKIKKEMLAITSASSTADK